MAYFPTWRLTNNTTVLPDERLPASAAVPMGIQHLLAMSGSTIVAPLIMGFDPNVAVCCGFLNRQRHFEMDWHLQFLDHTVTTCVLHSGLLT